MINLNLKNPVNNGIAGTLGMASWANAGFATDPKHLIITAVTTLVGLSSPTTNTAKPNISPESHVMTPYVNNIDEV
jgi:hypothetical protein